MTTEDDRIRDETLVLMGWYQTLLTEQRFDEWIELWADDAVCEYPFARPGRPSRLEGKAEILAYMADTPSLVTVDGLDDLQLHLGLDPHEVVVEMTVRVTATQTGRPYVQRYVIIARTEDGKLAHYREYWDSLVAQQAMT